MHFLLCSLLILTSCSGPLKPVNDDYETASRREKRAMDNGKFFGEALTFGGGTRAQDNSALGVNSCLWKATLDVLSFLPLSTADPFGGVILTDWYTSSSSPSERMKVNVRILDHRLKAGALKVTVFRQKRQAHDWVDQAVSPQMMTKLEDAILTKAREIHREKP